MGFTYRPSFKEKWSNSDLGGFLTRLSILFCRLTSIRFQILMTFILKSRGVDRHYFMRLDLNDLYLQVPLDKESQRRTTINTHKGLFMFWYCFFTRSISMNYRLIQGISNKVANLNDILIPWQLMEEHNSNLRAMLKRLQETGLCLRGDKCEFKKSSISYLGHRNAEGIHPTQEKVNAIRKVPTPKNVSELRRFFLAFVYSYRRYLNNFSTVLTPLYKLLQKGIP